MSPVFISNPNRMCPSTRSSSIALNNTQIRTFINIYPPSLPPPLPQNFTVNPIDLRKYNAAQALYHFYFPHLLTGQNQQQTHEIIDRGIKRSNHSDGKFHILFILVFFVHFILRILIITKTKNNYSTKTF
jgi:hypothetical protein